MHSRVLGRTKLVVSELGYGMWGIGGWSGSDDDESRASLRHGLAEGVTFFDSARAYGDGHSDDLLGELRREAPDRVVSASKIPPFGLKFPADPADQLADVYPLDHVLQCAELINESLGGPADLMQLHVWDDNWADDPLLERIISELQDRGLGKHFGLSLNRWEPWNGVAAVRRGYVDAVQVIYNIFDQAPEDELFPACAEHDVGIIARVALDEGSLGGNLTLDTQFPADDWRAGYFGPENLGPTVERVERLKLLVEEGMTLPEMAIRFILSNPLVSTCIVGMRKDSHLRENVSASKAGPLSTGLVAALREHRWDRQVTLWAN